MQIVVLVRPVPDTSGGRVVAASVAAFLGLPYLSSAGRIEIGESFVRVRRLSQAGDDLIEAPLASLVVCTQALGASRYASLKGTIAARAKEIRTMSLAEVGAALGDVGGAASRTRRERGDRVVHPGRLLALLYGSIRKMRLTLRMVDPILVPHIADGASPRCAVAAPAGQVDGGSMTRWQRSRR